MEKTPTQIAKVVAEGKLCFSCLCDKQKFRQCKSSRKCRKDGCNSSHNTLLHGDERVLPAKTSTNSYINNSKSIAGTSRPPTGQKQPIKTTTLSSLTDVKGLLQVTELKLINFLVIKLRRWFYAIPLAINLGCPIVLQINLVCRVPH